MLLGAHTSIAGGIDKAIERGDSLHCTAIQIFTKNSNQMKMAGKGYLEKSGMKKGMIFRLSGSLCKRLGESINYIRGKGVDELRYPELILEYIKEPFSCPFMKLPLRLHYLPLR